MDEQGVGGWDKDLYKYLVLEQFCIDKNVAGVQEIVQDCDRKSIPKFVQKRLHVLRMQSLLWQFDESTELLHKEIPKIIRYMKHITFDTENIHVTERDVQLLRTLKDKIKMHAVLSSAFLAKKNHEDNENLAKMLNDYWPDKSDRYRVELESERNRDCNCPDLKRRYSWETVNSDFQDCITIFEKVHGLGAESMLDKAKNIMLNVDFSIKREDLGDADVYESVSLEEQVVGVPAREQQDGEREGMEENPLNFNLPEAENGHPADVESSDIKDPDPALQSGSEREGEKPPSGNEDGGNESEKPPSGNEDGGNEGEKHPSGNEGEDDNETESQEVVATAKKLKTPKQQRNPRSRSNLQKKRRGRSPQPFVRGYDIESDDKDEFCDSVDSDTEMSSASDEEGREERLRRNLQDSDEETSNKIKQKRKRRLRKVSQDKKSQDAQNRFPPPSVSSSHSSSSRRKKRKHRKPIRTKLSLKRSHVSSDESESSSEGRPKHKRQAKKRKLYKRSRPRDEETEEYENDSESTKESDEDEEDEEERDGQSESLTERIKRRSSHVGRIRMDSDSPGRSVSDMSSIDEKRQNGDAFMTMPNVPQSRRRRQKRSLVSQKPVYQKKQASGWKKVFWKPEEIKWLRIGYNKYKDEYKKWQLIYDEFSHHFHNSRTPGKLKDKYRLLLHNGEAHHATK